MSRRFGRVERMNEDRTAIKVSKVEVIGAQKRGRPKVRLDGMCKLCLWQQRVDGGSCSTMREG